MDTCTPEFLASDRQFIKQAQEGDSAAFGMLYERHSPAIFRYLYAHLSNRLDAEDLTEEVFLRVWRSLPRYREHGVPFIGLLFRVARNALIDFYRRSGHAAQDVNLEFVQAPDGRYDPGEVVVGALERQELQHMLGKLNEDYQTVLLLRFISELSPEETARAMGRTIGAVRVLQHRALTALRSMINISSET